MPQIIRFSLLGGMGLKVSCLGNSCVGVGASKGGVKIIELKASTEEAHGGTGRTGWIINSTIQQKNEYLKLIEKIQKGYILTPNEPFLQSDANLNETYQKVLKTLKERGPQIYQPSPEEVKNVQRLWISYRDISTELFKRLNPHVNENVYKSWLTEKRNKELEKILVQGK